MLWEYLLSKTNPEKRPIQERTRKNYAKTFCTAYRFSVDKRTIDPEEPALVSLTDIVSDYLLRTDLAQSTRLNIRSAFLWYFHSGHPEPNADLDNALTLIRNMNKPKGRISARFGRNTISPEDLTKLLNFLDAKSTRSEWGRRSAAWIRAGLVSGARPVEWLDAQLVKLGDTENSAIRILNAKVKMHGETFRPANPIEEPCSQASEEQWFIESLSPFDDDMDHVDQHRSVRIVPLEQDLDLVYVKNHMQLIDDFLRQCKSGKSMEINFSKYHMGCCQAIARACASIWKGRRSYCLYTMRGQFSANMKAAKGTKVTAELLGHSNENSPSKRHYGNGSQAHAPFKGSRKSQITDSLNLKLEQLRSQSNHLRNRGAPRA